MQTMESMKSFWKPVLPREHGAWGMWIVPFVSTLLYLRSFSIATAIFFIIFFLGFVSRAPVANLFLRSAQLDAREYRRQVTWAGFYILGIAVLLGFLWLGNLKVAPATLQAFVTLLALAALLFLVQLIFENFKWLRTILGEALAVLGLSLAVPVAALSVNHFESSLYGFWLCQVLYFMGPIFYVKMKLAGIKFKKIGTPVDKARMGTLNLGYYTLLTFVLLGASHFQLIRNSALIAFAPAIVRAFEGTINLRPNIKLKSVGWKEVVYSVWFGLWLAV